MGAAAPALGGEPMVQRMHGELDEPIRKAAGPGPLVPRTRAGTEWLERNPQGGPADRVEHAVQGQPTVLTRGELEIPGVDGAHVLSQHGRGIAGMASVGAVKRKA